MGSKARLLPFIAPVLKDICGPSGVLVDLMAGTQAVGYAMRPYAHVVSNDVQTYSAVFGRALVSNTTVGHVRDRIDEDMRTVADGNRRRGWLTSTYGDTFFSSEQCSEIEEIRHAIQQVPNEQARCVYLVALAYAMSHCQSSPGHFAQYMPSDHPRIGALRSLSVAKSFLDKARSIDINVESAAGDVLCEDVFALLGRDDLTVMAPPGSVAYLDPPYSTAQYSRYYHLIETVFRNDQPLVSHKGLYRPDRHQSPFCSTRRVADAFRRVASASAKRQWRLVVSYADSGILSQETLMSVLRERYADVEMLRQHHPHSMQGRGTVQSTSELLFVCRQPH
jgi:adenine-specific DNA-methyltransferase